MAYISQYTGKQVDEILAWAVKNKGIQIDTLFPNASQTGTTTAMQRSDLIPYDLVFVHGYVDEPNIPNQGMLIFDPNLIFQREDIGGGNMHGVFSTTVFRGKPGDGGAPIAIEVFVQDNGNWIEWQPCYNSSADTRLFHATHVVGVRSITPYNNN